MLPPAPPLFSTKTEPPISCCIHPAIMRAEMSEGPPGVFATTILIGRSGDAASSEPIRRNVGAARPVTTAPVALSIRRRDSRPVSRCWVISVSSLKVLSAMLESCRLGGNGTSSRSFALWLVDHRLRSDLTFGRFRIGSFQLYGVESSDVPDQISDLRHRACVVGYRSGLRRPGLRAV